ncbi:MAG: hypothetical protein OER82_00285 [Nitrosopumilus sp.]|nr:hypothetical protein [Nitrosopumilus sp.]
MGTVGNFVIDSVIMEEGKIKGFAVYPLYGENNFKSVRMIMCDFSLNTFRTEAHNLYLHNPTNQDNEFYKISIEGIDTNGFPIIQKISDDNVLKIFKQLPTFQSLPGDAT